MTQDPKIKGKCKERTRYTFSKEKGCITFKDPGCESEYNGNNFEKMKICDEKCSNNGCEEVRK